MKRAAKQYVPVGPYEKATGICPMYIAWIVRDELQQHFQAVFPDTICEELAERAEWILAHNAYWRRKFMGRRGRSYLISFMRHWFSAHLCKTDPNLFKQLPDSYQIGHSLPLSPCPPRSSRAPRSKPSASDRIYPTRSAFLSSRG